MTIKTTNKFCFDKIKFLPPITYIVEVVKSHGYYSRNKKVTRAIEIN